MNADDLQEAFKRFTTTVALITTHGSKGPNVMAAEWVFHVSYEPFLISIHVRPKDATHDAIVETGEFGVNIVSEEQLTALAFAGHFSKRETDKLTSELFETYPARRIKAPMIKGCPLNAECRVVQAIPMGDHVAFIGEVVDFSVDASKEQIAYCGGPHHLGARIERKIDVAVAVTPMECNRGSKLLVEGELTSSDRGGKEVNVSLLSPRGAELAHETVTTDDWGYFQWGLSISPDVDEGDYRVVARHGKTVGGARLKVA